MLIRRKCKGKIRGNFKSCLVRGSSSSSMGAEETSFYNSLLRKLSVPGLIPGSDLDICHFQGKQSVIRSQVLGRTARANLRLGPGWHLGISALPRGFMLTWSVV